MTIAIGIIISLVATCWIGSVIAYFFETRSPQSSGSFQSNGIHPRWVQRPMSFIGFPIWCLIASFAVVLVLPIFVIEWMRGRWPPQRPN